jgi:hypothetical protein
MPIDAGRSDGGPHRAAFRPGDDRRVVRAAFSCPGCLRGAREVALVDAFAVPVAEVACAGCGRLWQIELDLAQLAELLVAEPPAVALRLGGQASRLRRGLLRREGRRGWGP